MRKILITYLLLPGAIFALSPDVKNDEELLFARRIVEFWRDQDRTFIQSQIENFLSRYPDSEFNDHFYAILADISLEQMNFEQALASYALIKQPEVNKRVRMKRWYALYQLKRYAQLYYEIGPQIAFIQEDEGLFYYAEATLREALNTASDQEIKKHKLFEEALAIYSKLQHSDRFAGNAQLAMAEIYRYLGRLDQAASLYLVIAQEQKSPQILYHAATLLALCDETKALDLFAKLAKGGGTRAADAAYQWLQLLAKTKQWSVLKKERRCFLSTLTEAHLCIYYFYLGMLTYEEGHFDEAIEPLKQSLLLGLKPPYDKAALTSLLSCAKEMACPEASDYAYALIKERYPDALEEASLIRGLCYRKAGRWQTALDIFSNLIAMGHSLPILETAYLESIHLLMEQKTWALAHTHALEFLARFPVSLQRNAVVRLMVELSLADLPATQNYMQLANDLEQALNICDLYDAQQLISQHLLLAKCYVNLGDYAKSLALLNTLAQEDINTAEFHYLLALSYLKSDNATEKFIEHGEKTLVLDRDFYDATALRLLLFNAYLDLSQRKGKEECAQHAADHLYTIIDTAPLSLENQLWLAHTYAKQPLYLSRARHILEKILLGHEEKMHKLQPEVFLLASVYQQLEEPTKALNLLEPLYHMNPALNVSLCLALVHKDLGHDKKALALLQSLENCSDLSISRLARLQHARLTLTRLAPYGEATDGLQTLKELWMQKSLNTEPVHLEAALDYLNFYAKFHPKEPRLALMLSIKEHFTQERDLYSKDYHEARRSEADKDGLYQAYMRLLDAKICLAEAQELKLSPQEVESKKKAAHALFATLAQGKYAVTNYLTQQARLEGN